MGALLLGPSSVLTGSNQTHPVFMIGTGEEQLDAFRANAYQLLKLMKANPSFWDGLNESPRIPEFGRYIEEYVPIASFFTLADYQRWKIDTETGYSEHEITQHRMKMRNVISIVHSSQCYLGTSQ